MKFNENTSLIDVKTTMIVRESSNMRWVSVGMQILKIIIIQIKLCWALTRILREIDIVIFYVGGANLFLPVLMAKILKKKVITSAIGLGSLSYKKANNGTFFSICGIFPIVLYMLEMAIFSLSDRIIVESTGVKSFLGLGRYDEKIFDRGARYINNEFQIKKPLDERGNLVGYIGRLEKAKGIMNFVEAMPLILNMQVDIKFFLGGQGQLYNEIKNKLRISKLSKNVEMTGWLTHEEVADYYNELKLFILPSYSEGLPTCILEAMACGTPVLATPVGGVPDLIKDGETGFIMENNSAECIAENVMRILKYPNLEDIIKNAKKLIDEKYNYDAAVDRYRDILRSIQELS